MSKLQELKKIIQEANPEIMELKFGCEIDANVFNDSFADSRIYDGIFNVVSIKKETRFEDNDFWSSYVLEQNGKIFIEDGRKIKINKILGRPIRLTDVLLAIGDKGLASLNITDNFVSIIWNYTQPIKKHKAIVWNLKETLDNQSEETINFLYKILNNK